MIEIFAIGGYSEIGRNMTALRTSSGTVILDSGLWLEKVIEYEDGNISELSTEKLWEMEAIPDDREFFKKYGGEVKALLCTHAHLDHCGAIPMIVPKYQVPVIATPFTIEVIKKLFEDRRSGYDKLIKLNPGSSYDLGDGMKVHFIYATHSTPQTVIICLETKDGRIIYANDFKFDEYPALGKRTDYEKLRKFGKKGVKLLISDSTRIDRESRTHSESLVREMLRDILFWVESKGNLIILTTFSSHIARIKTIIELVRRIGREPILAGRSLASYVECAERIKLVNFSKENKVVGYRNEVNKVLKKINKERGKYALICTGNQGEPNSVLVRIAADETPLKLRENDIVVFCSEVIPSPINQANRADLERKLRNKRVRIFKDVHVSGHAYKEDHRALLQMLKPQNYLPTHGTLQKIAKAVELANELGYELGKSVHILQNSQRLVIE